MFCTYFFVCCLYLHNIVVFFRSDLWFIYFNTFHITVERNMGGLFMICGCFVHIYGQCFYLITCHFYLKANVI